MEAKLLEDLKQAQLDRDGTKVSTLRLLISEINNAKITKQSLPASAGKRGNLTDEEIISVVQRELKKRKEATLAFRSGGRKEAASKEESEAKILEMYLPSQLDNEELTKIVESSITEVGASSISEMGKVIGVVMGKVRGTADCSKVAELVKERLSK